MTKKYITSAGEPWYNPDTKRREIKFYVVLTSEGRVKMSRTNMAVYKQYARAVHWAKNDGDSIMEVVVPLDQAPLFIRRKELGD